MLKPFALFFFATFLALAQEYKLESIATTAPDLPAPYAAEIAAAGYRVNGPGGIWCEVWFRQTIPTTGKPTDQAIALPIAQGTLLGVIRFPKTASDRRGQTFKPGVYTLRYSTFPTDGAHQGVAPQRDFALATPIASDSDPKAMPDWDKLVAQSKASGTAHAAVFSLQPPAGSTFPSVTKEGEHDIVLNAKVGNLAIGIIVAGKGE
jgi:hypothetical protein